MESLVFRALIPFSRPSRRVQHMKSEGHPGHSSSPPAPAGSHALQYSVRSGPWVLSTGG